MCPSFVFLAVRYPALCEVSSTQCDSCAPTTTPDDASNALNAAVAMQRRMLGINRELHDEGFPEIGVGMGLHTGEVAGGLVVDGDSTRLGFL